MSDFNRRQFIKLVGGITAAGLSGLAFALPAKPKARVVVVGGGYGGATAAKYLRLFDPGVQVTLIEKARQYVSCALSNEVLAGDRTLESLTIGFDGLARHGVQVVHDEVTDIDAVKKQVKTKQGKSFAYDYLVVSPGVTFRWGDIEGYDEDATELMPHAWDAGAQTLLLKKQIRAMPDGGTLIITAPPSPYRCPPGPYERAAQVAHYLKAHKPKCKVLIMDAKSVFSKQTLFEQGWKQHYGDMITWVSSADDGQVFGVEPENGVVLTEFDEHKADVVNVIPAQKAGPIAERSGLSDESGWCPVDQRTFESTLHKGVFVIGDACIAGAMPKSAYAANSQAKVCAAMIAARVNGQAEPEPSYVNTCYSLIAPDHGISVAAVYRLKDGTIQSVQDSGGVSPTEATPQQRAREALYAHSWFRNIVGDIWT